MLEIVFKILFFLSMLVVYANVTSTSNVIVIVCGYVTCVFSYYYFNNIQGAIDEWLNYFNLNARLNDTMNPSQISGYFVSRKYNKINNNSNMPSVGGKKIFSTLCSSENTFPKENNLLDSCGPSIMKTEYKSSGDLPSPIMKNCSLSRSNRLSVNLDLETYMNVNSPGFTSRVVDKAAESASYHIKYPAVRQVSAYRFDKSTLRQLSKMPKVNSTPALRIAPPKPAIMDLMKNESNEGTNDDIRSNNFLQVLKDISRKRNYSQEETDRTGCTPKKSRKTDVKNVVSSQYKRAHEDCSNDSIEDKSRKKRCDDTDRNYAKMMSFTSSMSVLAPEFSWNNHSKKRKSSKLEKLKNESPEKVEKFRKISKDSIEEVEEKSAPTVQPKPKNNATYTVKKKEPEIQVNKELQNGIKDADKTDSKFVEMFPTDEDGEYVRVASGKILNRTDCTYRKKLNITKIDSDSVIATEPEYVSGSSYVDDKTMKENLLKSLMNDIERKGEKNDSVIFYQNSIVEEIEKSVAQQPASQEIEKSVAEQPASQSISDFTSQVDTGDGALTQPSLSGAGDTSSDDKTMKENLSNNLMNDIERKDEKNDDVIFYQNSIVEEIEKNVPQQPASQEIEKNLAPQPAPQEIEKTVAQQPASQSIPVFTPQVNTDNGAPIQPSLYGAGDTSSNAFRQPQVSAPPVGVVNPLPQASQFGSSSNERGFGFGASQPFTFGSTPAATPATPIFDGVSAIRPTFNANTPSFNFPGSSNFSAGSSNAFGTASAPQPTSQQVFEFGSNNAPAAQPSQPTFQFGANTLTMPSNQPSFNPGSSNTFGAASAPQPTNQQVFKFDSNNAPAAPPSQPTFQFGANTSTMPSNQSFVFAAGAAPAQAAATNAGGFSIGSGGSNTRSRAMARPRKAK